MPTYEYACDACAHTFEEFQSISAAPLKKCPGCGKSRLRRLIGTGGGVIFKGSGFYVTDYRSDSYKQAADQEKPKAAEAKPDAKEKPKSAEPAPTPTTEGPKTSKSKKSR